MDLDLVERFQSAIVGIDDATASKLVGLSDEWVRQRRARMPFGQLKGPTRLKITQFLKRQAARTAGEPEAAPAQAREQAMPTPTFVEHVLFTAGRIAELANQIAAAAAQQQRVSYELGARAESEIQRAPSEQIVPAGEPTLESPKGSGAVPKKKQAHGH